MATYRYLVSGRVQGVWFRASTREQAEQRGIDGWARNLPDGRVEVLARGEPDALAEFEQWLWRGPERARVSNVERCASDQEVAPGFAVS